MIAFYIFGHGFLPEVISECHKPGLRTILLFICLIQVHLGQILFAQAELGIVGGLSNFQGDLPSINAQDGFKALIGPVIGFHGGFELSGRFQVRADLLYTRLEGDDGISEKPETRQRNLSFYTPVFQLAAGIDWNMFGHTSEHPGTITPYATVGASLFYFNPKTEYEGEVVALHPLGTEGQYLDDYPDQKPYSLFQPTLQLGGGIKWFSKSNIIIAAEGILSVTFTDYVDDASTIYISYPELLEKAGPLTAALANRQGEYLGTEPVLVPTGSARANKDVNDFFGMMTLRVCFPIEVQTGPYKIRYQKRRNRIECPQFQ